jgi:hypothetical protein
MLTALQRCQASVMSKLQQQLVFKKRHPIKKKRMDKLILNIRISYYPLFVNLVLHPLINNPKCKDFESKGISMLQ